MDASGKDGVVKHVLSGVNPAGCQVTSFKAPSPEELDHDFLWRAVRALPERGRIGIFNRSYYEEVVTVRIHPGFLEKQNLPPRLVTDSIWEQRCEDIVAFERYLARNGILLRKFFLHVSREGKEALPGAHRPAGEELEVQEERDVEARALGRYQRHWSKTIARTSTARAPWFVVPADRSGSRACSCRCWYPALRARLGFPHLDAGARPSARGAEALGRTGGAEVAGERAQPRASQAEARPDLQTATLRRDSLR
jgi:polyphosphate kinase 2 (PPK2 family)